MDIGSLQLVHDRLASSVRTSTEAALHGTSVIVGDSLEEDARRFLATAKEELPLLDARNAASMRQGFTHLLADVAALYAVSGDAASAERWRAEAERMAAGTKYASIMKRALGFPPWFVDARRIGWMTEHDWPEDALEAAEEEFQRRYAGNDEVLALALG